MQTKIHFAPWVGNNYESGGIFRKKIMILGQSHYGDDSAENDKNLTNAVLKEYLEYPDTVPSYLRAFKVFERSLVGKSTDNREREAIWNSLVFYNYVQTLAAEGPRKAPKKKDYQESSGAFFEVLETYRPQYVIVWGPALWYNLPEDNWIEGEKTSYEGIDIFNGCYNLLTGEKVRMICVNHPSSGNFSWDFWHKALQLFGLFSSIEQSEESSPQKTVASLCAETTNNKWFNKTIQKIPVFFNRIININYWDIISWNFEDFEKIDQKEVFESFTKDFYENVKKWEWYGKKKEKRTLRKMDKLAKRIEVEDDKILISLFVNSYCERGKEIKTQIDESCINVVASTDSPLNIDYDTSLITDNLLGLEYYEREAIFSSEIKTRDAEPRIRCSFCNGTGRHKCPQCSGSGRERYIDGYYASGEEKIKTGACSECQGSGTIPCPECNGLGNIEIYAPKYAIIKSVEEKNYRVPMIICNSEGRDICGHIRIDKDEPNDRFIATEIFDAVKKKDCLKLLKINRNTSVVDKFSEVMSEASKLGIEKLYKENLKDSKELFDEENKGMLIAQQELHYLFPVKKIRIMVNEKEYDFLTLFVIPFKDSVVVCVDYGIPETGFLKGLFL